MIVVSDVFKKVLFNYVIKEKFECGIVLYGWEIKSIRLNGLNVIGSYVSFKNNELFLISSCISYLASNLIDNKQIEYRNRKLLLTSRELRYLYGVLKIKTYTLIPSKVYFKTAYVKIQICLCIGKKKHDKRVSIRNKEFIKENKIIKTLF